jgi:glycosyltransferase involved in cell wall biosynthesis
MSGRAEKEGTVGSSVSVLILTKDEEHNIRACIETLRWSDDIVLLDSHSSDRTVEIARELGARVYLRKFDTWNNHSNWALENIGFAHEWVYYSDADERVPRDLRDEILQLTMYETRHAAYRLRYRNYFLGSWVRHGGAYPVWVTRLYRPSAVRYEERMVNAHPVTAGSTASLRGHFLHYSFNKGIPHWFRKHDGYSDLEASEAGRVRAKALLPTVTHMVSIAPDSPRRALKELSFFLPMRSLLRFTYMYLLRLGFLDGRAGLHYALINAIYEGWISRKARLLATTGSAAALSDWIQSAAGRCEAALRNTHGKARPLRLAGVLAREEVRVCGRIAGAGRLYRGVTVGYMAYISRLAEQLATDG